MAGDGSTDAADAGAVGTGSAAADDESGGTTTADADGTATADADEDAPRHPGDVPWWNARRKSALIWGLVGALSFAVLYQAYVLAAGASWNGTVLAAGAVLVGLVTTATAYRLEYRIATRLG